MAEEKRSVFGEIVEAFVKAQGEQPKFGAEMRAVFRQGREDAWNSLIPAFPQQSPTRESGAPGTPTMQQTTEKLEGKEVNEQDRIAEKVVEKEKNLGITQEEVQKTQERSRGR